MRARSFEDRMANLTDIEVDQKAANERNIGQRMVSPGNVGNEMECQRETMVDGEPLINTNETAVLRNDTSAAPSSSHPSNPLVCFALRPICRFTWLYVWVKLHHQQIVRGSPNNA